MNIWLVKIKVPSTVEQTKFEYSPLGMVFTKGLEKKEDRKEGLFKRLKNIEGKNEEQLQAIEDQGKEKLDAIKNIANKNLKSISYFSQLSPEAKALFEEIKKDKNDIDPKKLVCLKTDASIFNFTTFKYSLGLASNIYNDKNLIKNAKVNQRTMKELLDRLDEYDPKNIIEIKEREEIWSVATKLYNKRQKVIQAFKRGIFPYKDGFQKKEADASDKTLPDWVNVNKKRLNFIKMQIQNAKKNNVQARPKRGSPIYFNKLSKLIQDIQHGKITHEEALKIITDIRDDIKTWWFGWL